LAKGGCTETDKEKKAQVLYHKQSFFFRLFIIHVAMAASVKR
jgi:hypothetical protein